MRETVFIKRLALLTAGCTVVLFAIFGFFPGSSLGGVMGLNVAGIILGLPVSSGVASRWIVAASMAAGVMVSGIMFITAVSAAGWIISTALYALAGRKRVIRQQNIEENE